MPGFEFVHLNRPGDEKKHSTRIRRHVMKDIGKARRKPRTVSSKQTKTVAYPVTADFESQGQDNLDKQAAITAQAAVCGPGEKRTSLVHQVFKEARRAYDPDDSSWWPNSGLFIEAARYAAMASAIVTEIAEQGNPEPVPKTSMEVIEWYTLKLELIAERLAEPREMVHDGSIIIISGLACRAYAAEDTISQDIYLQALKKLVERKGGIDGITNPVLRTLISWIDLSGATIRNRAPYFKVPRDIIHSWDTQMLSPKSGKHFQILLNSWSQHCPYLGDIRSALRATAAVANYINEQDQCQSDFWSQNVLAARILAPALHEVLSLEGRALPSNVSDPHFSGTAAREAFRRGLLIFLTSVKVKFGATASELSRHVDAFKEICSIPCVEWKVVPEFSLWAHTVAALNAETLQRDWHVRIIVGIMRQLGLSSSSQAVT